MLEIPTWNCKELSWKARSEVGISGPKLESSFWSWEVRGEIGKLMLKLESDWWSWKKSMLLEIYHWSWKGQKEVNRTFQLQSFQLKAFQVLVFSNSPFQLHVSPLYDIWIISRTLTACRLALFHNMLPELKTFNFILEWLGMELGTFVMCQISKMHFSHHFPHSWKTQSQSLQFDSNDMQLSENH